MAASTTSFISPAVSSRSMARATQDIGILPILSRLPVARASLGQTDAPQLRVGEDGIGHRTVIGREGPAFHEIGVNDLEVVEGDVRERGPALNISERPHARHAGLEAIVHADESPFVHLHARRRQSQVFRIGPAPRRDQQVGPAQRFGRAPAST